MRRRPGRSPEARAARSREDETGSPPRDVRFVQTDEGVVVFLTVALGVGSLLLFRVENGAAAALSWVTVAGVTFTSTALFSFFIWKGLAAQRLPKLQDVNRVVGSRGIAQTDVNGAQAGAVYVAGESWSAQADDKIPAGSPIVVVAREGLHLKVAKASKTEAG